MPSGILDRADNVVSHRAFAIGLADRSTVEVSISAGGDFIALLLTKLCDIEADIGTEINPTPPDGFANVLETRIGVGTTVGEDDEPAATLYQAIESGIIEMAAISEIAVIRQIVGLGEGFLQ